jgi:hypothetical protein
MRRSVPSFCCTLPSVCRYYHECRQRGVAVDRRCDSSSGGRAGRPPKSAERDGVVAESSCMPSETAGVAGGMLGEDCYEWVEEEYSDHEEEEQQAAAAAADGDLARAAADEVEASGGRAGRPPKSAERDGVVAESSCMPSEIGPRRGGTTSRRRRRGRRSRQGGQVGTDPCTEHRWEVCSRKRGRNG